MEGQANVVITLWNAFERALDEKKRGTSFRDWKQLSKEEKIEKLIEDCGFKDDYANLIFSEFLRRQKEGTVIDFEIESNKMLRIPFRTW